MVSFSKLLPACGFAIAAALAGVTSAFKEAPKNKSGQMLYTFRYNPPSSDPYSATHVEDVANWSYTADTNPCSGDDVEACKIQVPADYVNNPAGAPATRTLKPAIDIGTTESSLGVNYVSSTAAAGSGTISNKFE